MATTIPNQAQPQAAHAQPVDPNSTSAVQTPAPDPGVVSDPDRSAPTGDLLAILPQIKDLAQRVGGMKHLAEIVNTLAESKE